MGRGEIVPTGLTKEWRVGSKEGTVVEWRKGRSKVGSVVRKEWERVAGKPIIVVTDGGFKRSIKSTADLPPADLARWRHAQVMLREEGACGWVMGVGVDLAEGSDGSVAGTFKTLARGGGREGSPVGARGSAYRSELWGVVTVLRALCAMLKEGEGSAGPVVHWSDNESICMFLQRRGRAQGKDWRARSSRDLWAEIRGRLRYWGERGGTWESSWVKGHVDKSSKKEQEYTVAERMNMAADAQASAFLTEQGGGRGEMVVVPGALTEVSGGIWEGRDSHSGGWRGWWDRMETELEEHAQRESMIRYWQERQRRRCEDARQRERKWREEPAPVMDRRLMKPARRSRSGGGGVGPTVFKAKLWWDHLPSQQVRARGEKLSEEERRQIRCDMCEEQCEGSTWHVLAECRGSKTVIDVRALGTERIRAKIQELLSEGWEEDIRKTWLEKFQCRGSRWRCPPGWEEGGAKAGERTNYWYGVFGVDWLDDWCLEFGDEVRVYDRGVRVLRELGVVAVEVCREVWREVCRVRVDQERSAEETRQRIEHAERRERARAAREIQMERRIQQRLRKSKDVIHRKRLAEARHKAAVREGRLKGVMQEGKRISMVDRAVAEGKWKQWGEGRLIEWWERQEKREGRERRRKRRVGGHSAGKGLVKRRGGGQQLRVDEMLQRHASSRRRGGSGEVRGWEEVGD